MGGTEYERVDEPKVGGKRRKKAYKSRRRKAGGKAGTKNFGGLRLAPRKQTPHKF